MHTITALQNAKVNTAGAYVRIGGCYLFALGIRPHHGHIPVVRLGGHREGNETGWQCAEREVYEESQLRIKPCIPETTYWAEGDNIEAGLKQIQWASSTGEECDPCLVVSYRRKEGTQLSLMYLAEAEGNPAPSSEVKGLVLLKEQDVQRLCHESLTLEQYLLQGGEAILKAQFDHTLVLEPFAQLRLLSKILNVRHNLI
ncbi:MAG: NUDIX domain-containing protein [Anaerolineales bacterium]